MLINRSANKGSRLLRVGCWMACFIALSMQESLAQNEILGSYTFPDMPIKEFQNRIIPGQITNDRKVLLGSVGSDLWHAPKDPRDESWMLSDRGPNGQIKVEGVNRRTFWVPEFAPMILDVKTRGSASEVLEAVPIVGPSGNAVTAPGKSEQDETRRAHLSAKYLDADPARRSPE